MGVAVTWMCTVLCLTVFVTRSQCESLRSDDGSLAGSKWKAFVRSYVETKVETLDVDKQLSENGNEFIGVEAVDRAREQAEVEQTEHRGGEMHSGSEMHSRREMMHYGREMHSGGEISRQKRPVSDKEMFCDHIYISGSDFIQRQKGAYSLSPTNEWCHFDELAEYDLPLYQQDNGPNYVFHIGVVWNIGPNKCGYSSDYWLYAYMYNDGKTFVTDPTQVEGDWYYYYNYDYDFHDTSSMEMECFLAGYTIYPGVTCVGGTIAKSRTTDEPLETCLTRCYSRLDCIAIGFHKDNRWCDLFSSCPSQANSADYDMFFKNSNVPDNCAFLNGGCDHICTNDENADDYTCSCHTGYQLTADSHTCNKDMFEDLGDCSNNGGCAHVCIVTPVGHVCTCNRGYRLHDDGKSCTSDVISIEGEFSDCASLFDAGYVSNGVYDIKPPGFISVITVLCDQQTSGGGWTVFQRRLDGIENFYRNWYDYKNGFGSLYKEFWLGLDVLHAMTEHMYYDMTLRIELGGFQDEMAFAEYGEFTVADEDDAFKLNIGPSLAASGLSEDAMYLHNNLKFYTFDESHGDENLAERFQGGWWYRESAIHKTCVYACLNQRYYNYELSWNPYAITWNDYRYKHHSWKTTSMKFRPSNYCDNRRHC